MKCEKCGKNIPMLEIIPVVLTVVSHNICLKYTYEEFKNKLLTSFTEPL